MQANLRLILILGMALSMSRPSVDCDSEFPRPLLSTSCDNAQSKFIKSVIQDFKAPCKLKKAYPVVGAFYGIQFVYACKQALHNLSMTFYISFVSGYQQVGILPRDEDGNPLPFEHYRQFYDVSVAEPVVEENLQQYVIANRQIKCADAAKIIAIARKISPLPP